MGMQRFIRASITVREEVKKQEIKKHGKDKCPECGSRKNERFRNMLGTLECLCGRKFHGE